MLSAQLYMLKLKKLNIIMKILVIRFPIIKNHQMILLLLRKFKFKLLSSIIIEMIKILRFKNKKGDTGKPKIVVI
jgi:hypothetical protein